MQLSRGWGVAVDGVIWTLRKPFKSGPLENSLDDFKTATCRRVAQAYLALLQESDGAIPSKNGVDLTGFATAMADMALTAVSSPDQCIYRLAGERLQRRMGLNPIGMNYYDFVPDLRREQAVRAMTMVVDVPCGFRAEIRQDYDNGSNRMIEAVGLPLSSDEPDVDGFILFGDRQIDFDPLASIDDTSLLGVNVIRRDLIDLGYGVDESFEDLVPT